jgi:hypothetical protein
MKRVHNEMKMTSPFSLFQGGLCIQKGNADWTGGFLWTDGRPVYSISDVIII